MALSPECLAKEQKGGWWEDLLEGRCTFPIGPRNTWSNLFYIMAGCTVWPHTWAGGLSLMLLGVGSFLYHGYKTVFTDNLDNSGIYLVMGTLLTYVAFRLFRPDLVSTIIGQSLMLSVGLLLAWRLQWFPMPAVMENIVIGIVVGVASLVLFLHGQALDAFVGLFLFAVAYLVCWQMDRARTYWWPKWGHAHWHILTAAALQCFWLGIVK